MGRLPEKMFLKPCEIMEAYGLSRAQFRKVREGLTGLKLSGYSYDMFRRSEVVEVLGEVER